MKQPLRTPRFWIPSARLMLAMLLALAGVGQAQAAPADAGSQLGTPAASALANQAPQTPVLVAPANGAVNVPAPATLSVKVTDPDNNPMNVTFYGRPLQPAAAADFSIVAVPDPQYYAELYPSIFTAQMQWVVDNQAAGNIVYVAGLGDNVDIASATSEWQAASSAYGLLDTAGIPYGLAVGNHDIGLLGGSTTNFNSYFGISHFTGKSWYGGSYGSNNDNHYDLISAGGMDFIIIYIKYDDSMTSPPNPVLTWADGLLTTYASRRAIVVSHNMLNDGTSTDFSPQAQTIYTALMGHSNLFLMLGGHNDIASRRSDVSAYGTIYSMKSDYQDEDSLQSGYLRILRFSPSHNMIFFRTYSPTLGKDYDESADGQNNFNLPYSMSGSGFQPIGTLTGVASGSTATVSWPGLTPGAQYEWYAVATDGTDISWSDGWNFTTQSTYTISGNAGVAGATLSYGTAATNADASGNYALTVPSGWSGTLTPSKPCYHFSPTDLTYADVTADQPGQNFTAISDPCNLVYLPLVFR